MRLKYTFSSILLHNIRFLMDKKTLFFTVQMTLAKRAELSEGLVLTSSACLHTFAVLGLSVCRCARKDRGDLPGFTGAQYISRRLSSQLWKQHSSTMPRLCDRLELGPYPVGLPVGCIEITFINNLLEGKIRIRKAKGLLWGKAST